MRQKGGVKGNMDDDKLHNVLFFDEANKMRGEYNKDLTKAKQFTKAIEIINSLMEKTKLFAYRASDVNEPLYVHSIEIQWLQSEINIDAPELAKLFDCVQYFNTIKLQSTEALDIWLLTSEIYTEVER